MKDEMLVQIWDYLRPGGERSQRMRTKLGSFMLNMSYPRDDVDGASQGPALSILTPFKWLMRPPVRLNLCVTKPILFLHAQVEGGIDWLDTEIECRDLFITLNEDNGIWKEKCALQVAPFDGQFVTRVKDLRIDGVGLTLEADMEIGSYNVLWLETWRFEIHSDASITRLKQG